MHFYKPIAPKMPTRRQTAANHDRQYNPDTMTDVNYVDDLPASTIQQIFVPACLPRSPNIQGRLDSDPYDIMSLYACEDCSEKFVLQSSLKFHKDRCSVVIKFKCRQCILELVFFNRCNFLAHLRQHNLELNEEELSKLDVTTRPIPESLMPYFTLAEYHKENGSILNSEPQSSSACPECKVILTISLKEHFNNPITSEKDFNLSCKYCNLILPTKCCMKAHTRIHTKAGTLLCPDCCISFPIWESFWNHISNVCFHRHKVLRYECHKCTYIFKDCEKLQEHFLSRHLPKLSFKDSDGSNLEKAGLNILMKCDFCYSKIPQWRMKSHILAHSKDRSALNVVYQCPYSSCYFCCSEYNLFKRHFTSCLHIPTNLKDAPPNSSNEKSNSPRRDSTEITDGGTKQALDILKSKGNIVVHKIAAKRTYQAHRPVASGGGFRSVVRMPLTPSPEPLSEGSGKGHYNEDEQRASLAAPKVKKSVPGPGKSLLATRLGSGSNELAHDDPVNKADVLVVKMHQCTICKELIAYDRKSDTLKMHFKNKHRGKYKLGQIKRDSGVKAVDSFSELTSDSDMEFDAAKHAAMGMSSRNGAHLEDSPPPLLKKQKPLAVSPRRLANANRKEVALSPRKSWEIVSIVDSDDECLLTLKNRSMELQAIGTPRSKINVKARKNLPAEQSIDTEPVNVGRDRHSDSSSDPGPLYKRKRKRGSSSDPDFECSELVGYQPQLSDGLAIQRRRRTVDKKPATTTNQDGEGRQTTPQKKLNGSLKKKIGVQESKQKSPHNNDSKAYYSDVVNEYKTMGSGIVITTEDQSKDNFQCLKPDCLFTSNDSEAFREHIMTHRTDDNTFQCMECGICFVVKTTFAKHLIINHTIKDVDAYIKENDCCDKEIIDKNINELERLEKRKTENVPMVLLENQCKICFKVCADPLSLNIHFRTHGMAFLRMNQQEKNK